MRYLNAKRQRTLVTIYNVAYTVGLYQQTEIRDLGCGTLFSGDNCRAFLPTDKLNRPRLPLACCSHTTVKKYASNKTICIMAINR